MKESSFYNCFLAAFLKKANLLVFLAFNALHHFPQQIGYFKGKG